MLPEYYLYVSVALAVIASFGMLLWAKTKSKFTKLTIQAEKLSKELESSDIEAESAQFRQQKDQVQEKTADGKKVKQRLVGELRELKDKLYPIEHGLYPPVFELRDSEEFKGKIMENHDKQYQLIRANKAISCYLKTFTLNDDEDQGAKMVEAYKVHLLRALNGEFETIRKTMRVSSGEAAVNKFIRLVDQINGLASVRSMEITKAYADLKADELDLWYERLTEIQEQKEQIKKNREKLKKAKANVLDDDQLQDVEDEIAEQERKLVLVKEKAKEAFGLEMELLSKKITETEAQIDKLRQQKERSLSQAQITRAGYIYVISNIGSFGKNIVKIGMTRRLDPNDRVVELGDASVPYRFDTHALVFVEDAPAVENKLHKLFDSKRVNKENNRKEFFNASLQEVKEAFETLEIEAEWQFDVEAREYSESVVMRESVQSEATRQQAAIERFPTSI